MPPKGRTGARDSEDDPQSDDRRSPVRAPMLAQHSQQTLQTTAVAGWSRPPVITFNDQHRCRKRWLTPPARNLPSIDRDQGADPKEPAKSNQEYKHAAMQETHEYRVPATTGGRRNGGPHISGEAAGKRSRQQFPVKTFELANRRGRIELLNAFAPAAAQL